MVTRTTTTITANNSWVSSSVSRPIAAIIKATSPRDTIAEPIPHELDIEEFKRTGRASTFVGFAGIVVPLVLGYVTGIILNLTTLESWFLGLLLSATSVSISVQALKEMNLLKTPEGTTILGAAVIDDVVVIIALAFLMRSLWEPRDLLKRKLPYQYIENRTIAKKLKIFDQSS